MSILISGHSVSTGLPSSFCVVYCAFVMAVSVRQTSETKAAFNPDENEQRVRLLF